MKRIVSICITLILWFGMLPMNGNYSSLVWSANTGNKQATFMAMRLHRAGYDTDGTPIDPDPADKTKASVSGRFFPWEFTRGSSWGRKEVYMPGSPVYWFELFLTIRADSGKSKPENRWVGVIDSSFNMWLDPDGNFHDSNYDVLSDKDHPAYIPGRCENNPRAQVDPLSNTQGPYVLNPKEPSYRPEIYFYDKLQTGRAWRIGWVDMVDYIAAGNRDPMGIISDGTVMEGDWDLRLEQFRFRNDGVEVTIGSNTYQTADYLEEWHTDHIVANNTYDWPEFIYSLGANHVQDPLTDLATRNSVQPADQRITMVSVIKDGVTYTYNPGSIVNATDKDVGMPLVNFNDNGNPVIEQGEEIHTGSAARYSIGNFIYMKLNGVPNPEVQVGDIRLSNVNTRQDSNGLIGPGIFASDVMIFAEVLEANCNGTDKYDLSVETDIWLGVNPSVTAARLFSANGDVPPQSQRIQKSTVLDTTGREFIVPATTFHDISLGYRGFLGVEIFADNGIDANICANIDTLQPVAQNDSDDYINGRIGEEYIGTTDGNFSFDHNFLLSNFQSIDFYHDVNAPDSFSTNPDDPDYYEPHYGCGEAFYRKEMYTLVNPLPVPPGGIYRIEMGDLRLSTVTVERNGQRITYDKRTHVMPGDLDIGLTLFQVPSLLMFVDDPDYNVTGEYDEGETLYQSADGYVNSGDIRLTEMDFGGKHYPCNSPVDEYDFWIRQAQLHMMSMGKSGDGRAIDMEVMPGLLDMDIQLDKPFQVEQTTHITAKLNTPVGKDNQVHLIVKEPEVAGFGGVPAPQAYYAESVVAHEWLPKAPEGEDEWDYRVSLNFDNRRGNGSGAWWPVNYASGRWSDPLMYLTVPDWWGHWRPENRRTPLGGPRRGPYAYDLPTTPGGAFTFPFLSTKYRRIWIDPYPVIQLNNGGGPIGTIAQPYWAVDYLMSHYYNLYTWMYPTSYGKRTPSLYAYGGLYYTGWPISPCRFYTALWNRPAGSYYQYSGGEVGYYNDYSYPYGMMPYGYADYVGEYNIDDQPLTTGIWAYVDEESTPRRLVITWLVNFSYDRYSYYNSYWSDSRYDGLYPKYEVQIVLYEDGTFQYNYNYGNKNFWQQGNYPWSQSPAVGYYNGNSSFIPAQILPHHNNDDLELAPSVRFTFYQPPGKIDPHNPWNMYADYRILDDKNPEISFEYTPYRGTCKEDGTRDRLEILAFLEKGGVKSPLPIDPTKDVYYEQYDLPVGVAGPENGKQYVYVDMDSSQNVTAGDIRLTAVNYSVEGVTGAYNQGTVVISTDVDCVQVGDTQAASTWKMYVPSNALLGSAVYIAGSEVKILVYVDMNENGFADQGDIRLVGFSSYAQGSVVQSQDWEVYRNYRTIQTPLFPQDAPIGIQKKKYVYYDRDYSQTMTRFDVRLTAIDSYLEGSQVSAGDLDLGKTYRANNVPIGVHDPLAPIGASGSGPYNSPLFNDPIGYKYNAYAHLGDPDNPIVEEGDIRLGDCVIVSGGGTITSTYKKGTIVAAGDLDVGDGFDYNWAGHSSYKSKVIVWDNEWGRGIYLDVNNNTVHSQSTTIPPGESRPGTGDIRLAKNFWKKGPYAYGYPPVSQNWYYSQYGPMVHPAGEAVLPFYYPYPNYYYYDEQGNFRYYPKFYNTFDNWEYDNGYGCTYAYYQYGYYPGYMRWGCTFYSGVSVTTDNLVYINSNPQGGAVKAGDYRINEIGELQQGSYVEIDDTDRQTGFMFDPYWSKHPWTKLELDKNPFKSVYPIPTVVPSPTIPSKMTGRYDCYLWNKYDIIPEVMELEADQKCLPLNPQRFPNLTLRVMDADNPNDVNDPANVAISGHPDEPMVMNYNAHGGGIKFMFTAVAGPLSFQKYIGQYNEDDTVVFWYWYDNVPYGVLDVNDFLKSTYDCNKTGYFKPVGGDPYNPYWMQAPPFPARIRDIDCSFNQSVCTICGDTPGFPKLGEVNNRMYYFAFAIGDVNGRTIWNMGDWIVNQNNTAPSFDGITVDPQISYCQSMGDGGCSVYCYPQNYGTVWTYGVPVQVTSWSEEDEGGRVVVPVKPFNTETPVTIRLYSARILYDYNTRYPHGGAFIHDTGYGIDYCGTLDLKVLEPDPKVNFGEFQIIDHGLQNSKVNYTSGADALSPMIYPTPMIHADYNPILEDYIHDIRAYPGGQTHTGRIPKNEYFCGFNSYPSLWPDMYNKLGTEMFPFTDYGISFILHDGSDNRIWWDAQARRPDLNIKAITVEGAFMRPRVFERVGATGAVTQSYRTTYPDGLPVQYDFSGKVVIDTTNYDLYSFGARDQAPYLNPPIDLSNVASPKSVDSFVYKSRNARLQESRKMWYGSRFSTVTEYMIDNGDSWPVGSNPSFTYQTLLYIDEIIPISNGKLSITVELYDGTIKKYQDCCNEILDDLPINGLEVTTDIESVTIDTDTKVQVQVKEYDTKGMKPADHIIPCNDALVLMWQDRGVKDASGKVNGAGDGWITVPPRSSAYSNVAPQLNEYFDINSDGKVSYQDYETEIIGTYDMASNTWKAGVMDARTFQRNDGTYLFDLSAENGALVDTIGMDFGGPVSRKNLPDHVIDDFEILPLYITAFKYGDDDNDRGFSPWYSLTKPYEFSHEVYLSGLKPLDVVPKNDWVVTFAPEPLTAGCVPELLQGETPLTFNLLDSDGNPVDLSKGIADPSGNNLVEDINIWNVLIKDPHKDNKAFYGPKAVLPRYYWLRTDLHNDDGTMINNYRMFSIARNPFLPIETDFSAKEEGKYLFKGFCANDEGQFDVFIDSPDRKHRGKVEVKVKSPNAAYAIRDYKIQYSGGSASQSNGQDTDFILTTHNNSMYWIYPFLFDATGNPIVGNQTAEECAAVGSLTRFTPYTTKPDNFNYSRLGYQRYYWYETTNNVFIVSSLASRYHAVGWGQYEKDPNYLTGSFFAGLPLWYKSSWTSPWYTLGSYTYYNTEIWQWENGLWALFPVFDLPPADNIRGMGRGAIYNSPKGGGYCFVDWNGANGYLDAEDSVMVSTPGATFYLMSADDALDYGVLIGKNPYSNSKFGDVAGGLGNYRYRAHYPGDIRYRYNQYLSDTVGYTNADGTYRLDWDAFPTHNGKARKPKVTLVDEATGVAFGKDLLNTFNYDLIYGKQNHLHMTFSPNSSPNFPMIQGVRAGIYNQKPMVDGSGDQNRDQYDAKAEAAVEARTVITGGATEYRVDGTTEAIIRITPTGLWDNLAQLVYWGPDYNMVEKPAMHIADFDVVKAMHVEAKTSGKLYANQAGTLFVYVSEFGTDKPLEGASVNLKGPGVTGNGKTDKNGLARFDITPNAKGVIEIRVSHSDLGDGYASVFVLEAGSEPAGTIDLDPTETLTNKDSAIIAGTVSPGSQVSINQETVPVSSEGRFEKSVTLKEGENQFIIEVLSPEKQVSRKIIVVNRDTTAPVVTVDPIERLVDVRELVLTGKVNENAVLTINNQHAVLSDMQWKSKIALDYGKNNVTMEAKDLLGNTSKTEMVLEVFRKMTVSLTIGKRAVLINGLPGEKELDAAPFIKNATTFVPIRFIAEAFGAKVTWTQAVKGISIEWMEKKIEMQIGSKKALINGKEVRMEQAPTIVNETTFVPLRFVAESLSADVEWIEATREIIISIFAY
ncbi:hypothetical protein LLG10_01455 [bacterium]|nr:hypothetical protein [bacterium]